MNKIGRRITEKLIEIHGSTDFSIAFLPYKRSMWNSMESVYQECKAAGAQAYCIPVPYFKVLDGKLEGVSSDRPFFSEACDISFLEQNTFDFVVIHYPYDDKNKVTRMCSAFHTAQLRKYGKVVYIPYSCTNMRQLRVQPGIANADYVFLGSENEAELFATEWQEFGIDFSGRVFGLGSPKMDAMQKLKSNHEPGDKSVTLVINSLGPYLSSPFEHLEVYKLCISNEIEAGHMVIFRPHPLLRQTIRSMRPDTLNAYEGFLTWCDKQDDVWVDESEYLEDALEQADFLISDPSSVLEMWISTEREYRLI